MKIITTRKFLKKIIIFLLVIILFFLLKIFPVNAMTNYNFNVSTFSAIDTYLTKHPNNNSLDFYEMILSNINYEPPYENYICNISNSGNVLDCFSSNSDFTLTSYYSSGGILNLYNSSSTNRKLYTITFDSNGEYVSRTLSNYNLNSLNLAYAQPSGSSKLWSLPIASNFQTILFDNSTLPTSVNKIDSITFNSNITYNNNSMVDLKEFSKNTNYRSQVKNYYGGIDISYELIKQNGYYDLKLNIQGYTPEMSTEQQVLLIDTATGKETIIQPSGTGIVEQTIQVFYSNTFKFQVIDLQYNVLKELIINVPNIEYNDFYVNINNISKENKTINYSYVNNGIETNYTCYHEIVGNSQIEDTNCNNTENNYTINVPNNESVNFYIYDNSNNLIFKDTKSFILDMSKPYIQFVENYDYNLLNLKLLLSRYDSSYITKYSINNGTLITIQPTQEESYYEDVYSYTLFNITENTSILVYIYDSNNNLLSTGNYFVSSAYIEQKEINTNSFKNLFNNLSFNNISTELITMVKNFGNIILSSKLGIIIYTSFVITLIGFIIHLIRR